jgi:hypothetical protein
MVTTAADGISLSSEQMSTAELKGETAIREIRKSTIVGEVGDKVAQLKERGKEAMGYWLVTSHTRTTSSR